MRILIHDYPGFAFPLQLSRELVNRKYEILYLYAGYNVTPKGPLTRKPDDSPRLVIKPIFISEPLKKYSLVQRWQQEREYGKLLSNEIAEFQPEVVISGCTPLDTQSFALKAAQTHNIRFVFWLQDITGIATKKILQKKIPVFGELIGRHYIGLEKSLLEKSTHIVSITEDFIPQLKEWGISLEKISVIPNWAPIEDIAPQPKLNDWSVKFGLSDRFCFMYTGTLGFKHNPELLVEMAVYFQNNPEIAIVVVSEGPGAEWLKERKIERELDNLLIFDYQPYYQLSNVMGTADVLIAILEPDAGVYSVPSKVQTYLCAMRPILLSVPEKNLAAKTILQNEAGLVVSPNNPLEFITSAELLYNEKENRERFARNGRNYAENNFDIKQIADKFQIVLS